MYMTIDAMALLAESEFSNQGTRTTTYGVRRREANRGYAPLCARSEITIHP